MALVAEELRTSRDENGRLVIECVDLSVFQLRIDWAVTLLIGSTDPTLEIRVENPFSLEFPGQPPIVLDPEAAPHRLAPLLTLVRQQVSRVEISEGGCLEVDFGGAAVLSVRSGGGTEAWQVSGLSGVVASAAADGGMVIWSDGE